MAYSEDKRTIVNLLADVVAETTELLRSEIRLLRAETRESAHRLLNSGTLIGVGAIAALAALFLLLQAIVGWLALAGLPVQWGYTIVGAVAGIVAFAVLRKGIDDLRAAKVVPEQTLGQLKADVAAVKEHAT